MVTKERISHQLSTQDYIDIQSKKNEQTVLYSTANI